MIEYVSLHNRTDFSVLNSLASPKELFKRAKELEQTTLAVTDLSSMAGIWASFKAAKEAGIKFIPGVELYFADDVNNRPAKLRHIVLLAKNYSGYSNILKLERIGFDTSSNGKKPVSIIDWQQLKAHSEGVICLTGCGNGIIAQHLNNKQFDAAEAALTKLIDIFGEDIGIEIQAHNLVKGATYHMEAVNQVFTNNHLIRLAKKYNVKVIPTTNTLYINREDHEVHDCLLAIGAMQPIYSNARIKYNVSDLYLKSGDEIVSFFTRSYGEEFSHEICANTVEFANRCEEPVWIDPKIATKNDHLLPTFDVKSESDYADFFIWLDRQDEKTKNSQEDAAFLKFRCEKALNDKNIGENKDVFINRLNEELETLEYQKFSSYMLIVQNYVNWAKQNGVSVGPGRGCVDRNTYILTTSGYKKIVDINVDDYVFTNTGDMKKVLNKFSFQIDNSEELLKIKTTKSFGDTILTKDHKVLAQKFDKFNTKDKKEIRRKYNEDTWPVWTKAGELTTEHLLWVPYPIRDKIFPDKWNGGILDLAEYSDKGEVFENKIKYITHIAHPLSTMNVTKNVKSTYIRVKAIKNGSDINIELVNNISSFLYANGSSLDEWRKTDFSLKEIYYSRYVTMDSEFYYILGVWIGDGFLIRGSHKKGVGFSINRSEKELCSRIVSFFNKYGFNARAIEKKEHATQIEVLNEILLKLFSFFINGYTKSYYSSDKHLPSQFRVLNEENLKSLLNGLYDADGNKQSEGTEIITTTSIRLALETKEALMLLKNASSIREIKPYTKDGANRLPSYVIKFSSLFDNIAKTCSDIYKEDGFFARILEIDTTSNIDTIYDIEVDEDHSYLTSNLISHNSVGGSLVAYLLDIHKADPIKYDLIFARFQNRERKSPPDIDLDFSKKNREKIIDYIIEKYGSNSVAQVSNIVGITPKVYVRDVARACELGNSRKEAVGIGNTIADTIPKKADEKEIRSFNDAIKCSPLFVEYTKKYSELAKYASICGKHRSQSVHAAAIVASKFPLAGLIPLRKDKDNAVIIEYDKDIVEENGLVKMDILGLSTLDIIDETNRIIKSFGKEPPVVDYDAYDKKAYDLISNGDTFGVFQFGTSAGTIDLCRRIRPICIDDLAIITTLARPAAREIRTAFVEARDSKKAFTPMHTSLNGAFGKTYGFGLFDESILQLGRDVAGWSLHSADRIRKMIKDKGKNPDKDARLREEFINDAIKNNKIAAEMARRIWDEQISAFASYTFNKSHAVLYSMISFHTAYLKAHFPVEFLLANLMNELGSNTPDVEKNIDKIKSEIRAMNIKILPPNINTSNLEYNISQEGILITGLSAIKNVGNDAILDIISKRPFISFNDFMIRSDARKVRSNTIQALAVSGCFDHFGISRKQIYMYCSDYRKKLQVWLKKHDPTKEQFEYPWPVEKEWAKPDLYALEKEFIGETFISNKKDAFHPFFAKKSVSIKSIRKMTDKDAIPLIAAEIKDIFQFKVKKETSKYLGQDMLKATIEDEHGDQIGLTIFPKDWKKVKDRMKTLAGTKFKFEPGICVSFSGTVNLYDDEIGVILNDLFDYCPPPQMPKDLKEKKKVSIKKRGDDEVKSIDVSETDKMVETIEDELFDEGLIDLTDEDEEDDNFFP